MASYARHSTSPNYSNALRVPADANADVHTTSYVPTAKLAQHKH
jgi:hypothetical protein